MSNARWFEVESCVQSAVKHFNAGVSFYVRLSADQTIEDRRLIETAFVHALQFGHTSLEVTLPRILDLCQEAAPTGATRHADLISRVTSNIGGRPQILTG